MLQDREDDPDLCTDHFRMSHPTLFSSPLSGHLNRSTFEGDPSKDRHLWVHDKVDNQVSRIRHQFLISAHNESLSLSQLPHGVYDSQ